MPEAKVLITGVSGMIGRELSKYLLQRDYEVHGVARFSKPGSEEEIAGWGVRTWKRDLIESRLDDLPDDFDYIFHEAVFWTKGLAEAILDPRSLSMSTLSAGRIMGRWRDVKAMVLASTGGIYAQSETPSNEETPLAPNSDTYHLGKFAMEQVGQFCSVQYDVPTVILRYFWPIRFEQAARRVVDAVKAGRQVPGADDGEPYTWTPIDLEDVCRYTLRCVEAAAVPPTVLVCGGPVVNRLDLARVAAEALGVEPAEQSPPECEDLYLADSSKLFGLFGPPERDLAAMIGELAAAEKK
ncbi:MAG: NAD-dependent epimerase/dehydratase family protein [Planctomycetota bacterium]|jgi:nucleoside-diphosphate-sugar epimerase